MIIAMIAMLMVQPAIDEVVYVVSMRHSLMPTSRTMDMITLVAAMAVFRGAAVWIFLVNI